MKRRYLVVYEKGKRNYSGFSPDVPGCVSTAKTLEQMRSMMTEALEFHLQGIAEDGEPMPEATTSSYPVSFEEDSEGVLGYVVEWIDVKLPRIKAQPRKRSMRKAA
jgi:predicted RNase H-like HicB family nuclease